MLRLRPSEITLTAADVEETRRRMARRQAAAPSALFSTRGSRPHARPPRGPRLRRGPDRSRDDSIIRLGNIPVLRPQQVVHGSTDDEDNTLYHREDSPQDEARVRISYDVDAETNSIREQSTPSPVRNLRLPFRPVPSSDIPNVHLEQNLGQLEPQNNTDDHSTLSSKPPFVVPNYGQVRTNTPEETSEGLDQLRIQSSVDGPVEDRLVATIRGGNIALARSPRPHSKQNHVVDVASENLDSEDSPTPYLQDYFRTPHEYRFKQLAPHTDPPQRLSHLTVRGRTLSSSSDPSQIRTALGGIEFQPQSSRHRFRRRAENTSNETADVPDIFQEAGDSRPHSSFDERMRRAHARAESIQECCKHFFGRAIGSQEECGSTSLNAAVGQHNSQRFSEASSNASLPYSYYELPGSRHSSSQSQSGSGEKLPRSQYDGAAPIRQVSPGAYYSIRPSQVRAPDDARHRPQIPRVSSFSSPNLAAAIGQHGLSPLPINPYAREFSPQNGSRLSLGLVTPSDFVGNGQDAANAAQRDLVSPLELLGQRAAIQLVRVSAAMPTVPSRRPVPNAATVFQYQAGGLDIRESRRRRGQGTRSMRQVSGNAAHNRVTATGRYPIELPTAEPVHRRTERTTINSDDQSSRRGVSDGRSGQRSSENVPVGSVSTQTTHPNSSATHTHSHRVDFGRIQQPRSIQGASLRGGELQASPPVRFSLPDTSRPRDTSNRDPERSPHQFRMRRSMHEHDSDDFIHSSSPLSPYRDLRQTSQRQSTLDTRSRGFHGSTGLRTPENEFISPRPVTLHPPEASHSHHERLPHPIAYESFNRNPHRSPVPIPPAYTSRRPPIPLRVASRRISASQHNQENSMEAEQGAMRDEIQAAGMRYADNGVSQDIMDETPPKVGRFERAGYMVAE